MPELTAIVDFPWAFLDASAQDALVFAISFLFGGSPKFLGKVDVFDAKEPEVNIAVECLGTDNLLSGEQTFFQGIADASIQRPSLFEELVLCQEKVQPKRTDFSIN